MNEHYASQDRGTLQHYQHYLEAMDAIAIEKVASASAFFEQAGEHVLVDVGMASGTSSAILARLFPTVKIIGVDINPTMVAIAQKTYQLPNLSFKVDDGERLHSFEKNTVNGFFNCSAIHHITSYNGYDSNHALNTLCRQEELLKEGGVIVVRDFVKPPEKEVLLELSTSDKITRPSDSELLLFFAQTARSLAPFSERGFPVKEVSPAKPNTRRFRLFYTDAVEFIRRKDYYENWDVELQEEYGYFTQQDFEDCFRKMGMRIILSTPIYNQWIINNRYKGQFSLFDMSGNAIGFPPTNYLIAGEKVKGGKQIQLVRHLPAREQSFLHYTAYRNAETAQIYDVVERPNNVVDIIPFYREENRITILAKHGYPRPLANVAMDQPVLDGKYFSGYITEGITVAATQDMQATLSERFGIHPAQYSPMEQSFHYYTSPGGINEKVSAYFLPLKQLPEQSMLLKEGFSGFKTSGFIHQYDAAQLLNTAQTGALLEARLELNLYHLFHKNHLALPAWLGEKVNVKECAIDSPVLLKSLLDARKSVYTPCEEQAGFLKTQRSYFAEIGAADSHAMLEYVYPENHSFNTLVTLPVCMMNKQLYAGLEVRDLPVPQIHSGNSRILTVPAKRLPKDIKNLFDLNGYLSHMQIGSANVLHYSKLGEKYFPSIGITIEQVYPYVVCLEKATEELAWVSLSELNEHIARLEDAHLLICLARLQHALLAK